MNKIEIHRINEFNNKNRKIKLFIDNVFYKTIDYNSKITISTKKDNINLKAKIDWCTSKNYMLDFKEQPNQKLIIYSSISDYLYLTIIIGVIVSFALSVFLNWKISLLPLLIFALIPVYKITIDYRNYLRFKSI